MAGIPVSVATSCCTEFSAGCGAAPLLGMCRSGNRNRMFFCGFEEWVWKRSEGHEVRKIDRVGEKPVGNHTVDAHVKGGTSNFNGISSLTGGVHNTQCSSSLVLIRVCSLVISVKFLEQLS